jgi:hypothetical protein
MRAAAFLIALALPASAGATPPGYTFSTGATDAKMAMASRPDGGGKAEIEAADDFSTERETDISGATFTGLLPTTATLSDVARVDVEIYRVFPLDSTSPPSGNVPTRANSPSDAAFASRDSADGSLSFSASSLGSLAASNSVLNGIHPKPNQMTGGDGPASGQELTFDLTFPSPIDLPAGQYFFVPQVQLSTGDFYWLSAPRPIVAPGTPFSGDLQAWIRNAALEPDWLRVGTDIVGGAATFNGAFSLDGVAVCRPLSIAPSAPGGTVGTAYAGSFSASGGTAPDTISVAGLPPGLTVGSDGAVTGTPTQPGSFNVTATATDAEGCRAGAGVTITISAAGQQPGGGGGGGGSAAVLSKLFLRPARFRAVKGSQVHFTLSAASSVTLTVRRLVAGRRGARGRCSAPTRANRHHRRCTRAIRVAGSLAEHGNPGANVVRFAARLHGHRLRRGRYRLVAVPVGGVASTAVFRII